MPTIDYIYRATRDIIGGAMGGLMAAWALADINQAAITVLGVVSVLALGSVYYAFDYLKEREKAVNSESNRETESEAESDSTPNSPDIWPQYRAS